MHALCVGIVLFLASMAWGDPTPPTKADKARAVRITKLLNRYRRALKDARTRHREEVARLQARATKRQKVLRAQLRACNKQKLVLSKGKSCLPEAVGGAVGGFGGGAAVCLIVVGGLAWAGKLKVQP